MKISKIDRQFLIRWVGIGLVVGIGFVLEGYLNVSENLQGIASGLLGLVLQHLLLRKYVEYVNHFIFVATIGMVLNIGGGSFVGSVATNYAKNNETMVYFSILYGYSLAVLLLISIGQWLILKQEFKLAYLWIVGNLVTWIAGVLAGLAFFQSAFPLLITNLAYLIYIVFLFAIFFSITGSTLSLIFNSPKDTLETI